MSDAAVELFLFLGVEIAKQRHELADVGLLLVPDVLQHFFGQGIVGGEIMSLVAVDRFELAGEVEPDRLN